MVETPHPSAALPPSQPWGEGNRDRVMPLEAKN